MIRRNPRFRNFPLPPRAEQPLPRHRLVGTLGVFRKRHRAPVLLAGNNPSAV